MLFNAKAIGYPLVNDTKGPAMLRPILLTLCVALTLTGCARIAQSKLNPLNWFGRGQVIAPANPEDRKPLIPAGATTQLADTRGLIDTIINLTIDRSPAGGIVRATGVAATQGYFNAQLVLVSSDNGLLVYEFRVETPRGFEQIGTQASRQITAAVTLTMQQLAGVRQIQVRGARNAMASSR